MTEILLNLDGGEHDDEPPAIYALVDVVHVACGGHAGDDASMRRVVRACIAGATRVGAHPSYPDREGFGRRAMTVSADELATTIAAQCASLRVIAEAEGIDVTSAKPHGALYHAAHADPEVARACVDGIGRALGAIAIVGLGEGAFEEAAKRRGHPYLREAFADRGVRPDGSLVPRGEPGAVLSDPLEAARRARALARDGTASMLCVHGDTRSALAIVRAVHDALAETRS